MNCPLEAQQNSLSLNQYIGEKDRSEDIQKQIELDSQIKKNRKWTEEEHSIYVIFLDLNKEKIKSKFIRRSNTFFKEMATFITTKTPIQCRSHHQKYEDKYKYPHRIIKSQKLKITLGKYSLQFEELRKRSDFRLLEQKINHQNQNAPKLRIQEKKISKVSISCQTQIEGVQKIVFFQQYSPEMNFSNLQFLNYYTCPTFSYQWYQA